MPIPEDAPVTTATLLLLGVGSAIFLGLSLGVGGLGSID